ncbi:programmed cell death protein, putative [Entamoeba dispar SAW760]|uniref:Programmed cell death protein, putative n=1 Tax=Entamoeba dispar (strain ATCC PRA-260 / SAW760) TaxID=370354 RepID=B0EHT1_ENTDS|nr:programmed cell death protein, putative [Entamoeba dispar SAW760]EDR25875.1 programmed cell death protein, putative [Entamoeba dispar SAW760]|eukprot:EDR25875.1 programmed cell death protein, putative [Entamoeba dispar SAW760]
MEDGIICGFIEELQEDETPNPIMNRSGGCASWLGKKVPNNVCPHCQKPMLFMLQLYAPLEMAQSYHRVFYLFHCPFCLKFTVLRNQLPEGTLYDKEDFCESIVTEEQCVICGFPSSTHCPDCTTPYCCSLHCLYDREEHKLKCGQVLQRKLGGERNKAKPQKSASEYLIVTEPENELVEKEDVQLKKVIETMHPDNEDLGIKESDLQQSDPVWIKFNTKIAKDPSQVLRYQFNGKPLWIKSNDIPQHPPSCPRCGKQCVFEWQLLPQFIYATNLDIELNIDYGTIVVYSCPDSCGGDDYVNEPVVVQYFDCI